MLTAETGPHSRGVRGSIYLTLGEDMYLPLLCVNMPVQETHGVTLCDFAYASDKRHCIIAGWWLKGRGCW